MNCSTLNVSLANKQDSAQTQLRAHALQVMFHVWNEHPALLHKTMAELSHRLGVTAEPKPGVLAAKALVCEQDAPPGSCLG